MTRGRRNRRGSSAHADEVFSPPAPPAPPSRNSGRIEAVIVIVACLIGAFLRFWSRLPETFWLDEAFTILTASRSVSDILGTLESDVNSPLFYLLLHAWIAMFGDGEATLRFLPALLGSLLAPALYFAGRSLFGRTAGLVAALLAAFSPLHIHYSHEVRMYSLLPLLALAFLAALIGALERREGLSWRRWSLVALTGVLLIATHLYGYFIVTAAPVLWLLRGPRKWPVAMRLGAALAVIGAVALYLGMGRLVLELVHVTFDPTDVSHAGSAGSSWIASRFHPVRSIFESLLLFGAGYDHPSYFHEFAGPSGVAGISVLWLAVAGLVVAGLLIGWPRGLNADLRPRASAVLVFAAVGIGLPYLISVMATPIYLVGRYEIGLYSAWTLLVGASAQAACGSISLTPTKRLWGLVAFLAVYAALASVSIGHGFRNREPHRIAEKAAGVLLEESSKGDTVVMTGLTRAPLEYCLRRTNIMDKVSIESYPAELEKHMGWVDSAGMRENASRLDEEARDLVAKLRKTGKTVFLVEEPGAGDCDSTTALARRHLKAAATSADVVMTFFVRKTLRYKVERYRLQP